jgi:hypothetical protein
MAAPATLLAIIGWIGLGLLLVGIAYLISRFSAVRWTRKPAHEIVSDYSDGDSRTATFAREMGAIAPKPGGMAAWSNRADYSHSRTEQSHIAHDKDGR